MAPHRNFYPPILILGASGRLRGRTGLSAPIFWLRQKYFRFYPLRDKSSRRLYIDQCGMA
jgi:hypothetical protein